MKRRPLKQYNRRGEFVGHFREGEYSVDWNIDGTLVGGRTTYESLRAAKDGARRLLKKKYGRSRVSYTIFNSVTKKVVARHRAKRRKGARRR